MKIGLDFDGVIANTPALKSIVVKDKFGLSIPADDMIASRVIDSGLMSVNQYKNLLREMYHDHPEWHKKLEPMPGAIEGIQELQRGDHELVCITSRAEGLDLLKDWLGERGVTLDATNLKGHADKVHAVGEMKLDVFIEDDPSFIEPMVGIVQNLFLIDWPYNRDFEDSHIVRVPTWGHFMNHLRAL